MSNTAVNKTSHGASGHSTSGEFSGAVRLVTGTSDSPGGSAVGLAAGDAKVGGSVSAMAGIGDQDGRVVGSAGGAGFFGGNMIMNGSSATNGNGGVQVAWALQIWEMAARLPFWAGAEYAFWQPKRINRFWSCHGHICVQLEQPRLVAAQSFSRPAIQASWLEIWQYGRCHPVKG